MLDETAGGAVAQSSPVSCGAACGEMLSGIPQSVLREAAGAPTHAEALAKALGEGWRGGYVGPTQLHMLTGLRRPWAAELRNDGDKLGHFVVVDGLQDGAVVIRDPWAGGSTYRMAIEEFKQAWTGNAVFR